MFDLLVVCRVKPRVLSINYACKLFTEKPGGPKQIYDLPAFHQLEIIFTLMQLIS